MNYVLEGDADFNKTLLKALCKYDDSDKQNNRLCLISNLPLNENAVTLLCKHTFNYVPLFNEIFKQKKTPSRLEVQKLKKYQIKCPYCRTIHSNILPYNKLKKQRIYGVNWPPRYALQPHRCKALYASGKQKGNICNKACTGSFCKRHKKKVSIPAQDTIRCSAILKSGKNHGKRCNYKAKKNGRCGIHHITTLDI